MPTKIELIIDNQDDNDAFDARWPGILQLARALPGLQRLESGKVWPKEDGTPTPEHRTLQLYFAGYDAASAAVAGPEAGAFFGALFPMADNKVIALFTDIEES
jgi:hypothetical protein